MWIELGLLSICAQADENDQLQQGISLLQQQLAVMRTQLLAVKLSHDGHTPLPPIRDHSPDAAEAEAGTTPCGSGSGSGTKHEPASRLFHGSYSAVRSELSFASPLPQMRGGMSPMLLAMTPPECQAMLEAVEEAMQRAASTTPLTPGVWRCGHGGLESGDQGEGDAACTAPSLSGPRPCSH